MIDFKSVQQSYQRLVLELDQLIFIVSFKEFLFSAVFFSYSRSSKSNFGPICILLEKLCDGIVNCRAYSDDEDASMCSTSFYRIPHYCDIFWRMTSHQVTSSDVLCTLIDGAKHIIMVAPSYFAPHFSLSNTSIRYPDPPNWNGVNPSGSSQQNPN